MSPQPSPISPVFRPGRLKHHVVRRDGVVGAYTQDNGLPPGDFPGQSVTQIPEGAERPRSFAFHSWRDADWRREYMNSLKVFSVNGPIRERASWRFVETIADPAAAGDSSR